MKQIAIIGLVTLCAAGAYAQGTVLFNPYVLGSGIDAEVYSPNPAAPTVELQGDTAAQNTAAGNTPVGTVQTYTGETPIGGSSYSGTAPATIPVTSTLYQDGNLFTAELYALTTTTSTAIPAGLYVPGTTPAGTTPLQPVTQYQSLFNTTSAGTTGPGYFQQANVAPPDPGIPGTGFIGTVSRNHTGTTYLGYNAAAAVVAWYNGGGQFTTLAAAQAANVPWGQSGIFEITALTEPASVMTQDNNNSPASAQQGPTYLVDSVDYSSYLQSFSLTAPVPEPSTIALGVMGACAFLARRRKK